MYQERLFHHFKIIIRSHRETDETMGSFENTFFTFSFKTAIITFSCWMKMNLDVQSK